MTGHEETAERAALRELLHVLAGLMWDAERAGAPCPCAKHARARRARAAA